MAFKGDMPPCGVPAFRVPLMSYPFAYPPNCEATFQAINSKFSQKILPFSPLKLHHLMLPQITIIRRPHAGYEHHIGQAGHRLLCQSARLAEMAIITHVRPNPSSPNAQVPNAHTGARHAAHGTPEPPTFHFMRKKKISTPPSPSAGSSQHPKGRSCGGCTGKHISAS